MDEKTNQEIQKLLVQNKGFKVQEVIILVVITCVFSFFAGSAFMKVRENPQEIQQPLPDMSDELRNFVYEYQNIVGQYYQDVDEEVLLSAALKGVMSEIDDPYSIYMDEEDYSNLNLNLEGSYSGLGVTISKSEEDNYMIVASIFKNSPADKAGLKVGDKIVSLNGNSTVPLSTSQFSGLVLDSSDKTYVLEVLRGEETLTLNMEKSSVVIPSVESKVIEHNGKKVGYIYISIFANNTAKQFETELKSLEKKKIDSLIIDVRDNTGGHLTSVSSILSQMMDSSYVIYQLEQNGEKRKIHSDGDETKEYPIALLTNQYSASASEVLVGSLKDNLDAIVVGEKTYGKGTVQQLVSLSNGDQYKITTKKWLTPKGTWVNDTGGIVPDKSVALDKEYLENPSDETDNQLQAALEELTK